MSKVRLFSLLIVVGFIAVAALTAREAVATSLVVQQVKESQGIQRGRAAEAARWSAQAEYYANLAPPELAPPGSESQAHLSLVNLINAARYTGEALLEFERSGNSKALPVCISAETLAALPETIGGNRWKELVPVCGQ